MTTDPLTQLKTGNFLSKKTDQLNNPVLESDLNHEGLYLREDGAYTSNCYGPEIVYDKNETNLNMTYKMWYFCGIGGGTGTVPVGYHEDQIFYATSPDGLTWNKQGTGPVLEPPDAPDLGGAHWMWGDPTVVWDKDGNNGLGEWVMFYTAVMIFDGDRIYLKTNSSGTTYPPGPGDDVLTDNSGKDWAADLNTRNPDIPAIYTWGICRATSPDGLDWTPYNQGLNSEFQGDGFPVTRNFENESCFVLRNTYDGGFENSEVARPSVILEDGIWRMWYDASQGDDLDESATRNVRTLYRESTDGINWGQPTEVLLENLPDCIRPSDSWDLSSIGAQWWCENLVNNLDIDVEKIGNEYVLVSDFWYPEYSMPLRYFTSVSPEGPFEYKGELFTNVDLVPGNTTEIGPHNPVITKVENNRYLVSYGTMKNGTEYFQELTSGIGITEGFWTNIPNIISPLLLN